MIGSIIESILRINRGDISGKKDMQVLFDRLYA
jgi:hypothetical protein